VLRMHTMGLWVEMSTQRIAAFERGYVQFTLRWEDKRSLRKLK